MAKQQYVYFIADRRLKCIKVGIATDPYKRLKTLQTGTSQKLWLLGYIEGGQQREQSIHRRLRYAHVRGEWFEENAVLDLLDTIHVDEWIMLNPGEWPKRKPLTKKRHKKRWRDTDEGRAKLKAKRQARQHGVDA